VKMLSECQIAWIRVRRRFTRCLIRIRAVCIWNYSCDWRAKGHLQTMYLAGLIFLKRHNPIPLESNRRQNVTNMHLQFFNRFQVLARV